MCALFGYEYVLLAQLLERPNLVAVDMGGTSYDVSVVQGGRVSVVTQGEIDRLPVRLPMVEMRTIGAGGGSIARVDRWRAAAVGPQQRGRRARARSPMAAAARSRR